MKTFGDFFDVMECWAKEHSNVDAQIFLEEWVQLVSPQQWQEARALEFAEDLFRNFAEDMASYLRERIASICSDALWTSTMKKGHAFLAVIAEQGTIFGLAINPGEVDVPLSPSDALARTATASKVSETST